MISATPPPAAVTPIPDTPPPAAQVRLALKRTHGRALFVVAGERAYVRGTVRLAGTAPAQSGGNSHAKPRGDRVRVIFKIATRAHGSKHVTRRHRAVTLTPGAGDAGHFRVRLPTATAGHVTVTVERASSSAFGAVSAKPVTLRVLSADLHAGDGGAAVWLLQRELRSLRYASPLSGHFDVGTQNALIAYRKLTGLPLMSSAGQRVFRELQRRKGAFHVRYPRDGRHVEAILSKQVLAEIEHGKVRRIYPISSGKPSTPTVLGRYSVYLKTPGINSEGMVDSNYFIRGYAIHGYAEVPTYAASHGCLRLPIEDAAPVYSWVKIGTIVDVYD